jgi:hypothetical protein
MAVAVALAAVPPGLDLPGSVVAVAAAAAPEAPRVLAAVACGRSAHRAVAVAVVLRALAGRL